MVGSAIQKLLATSIFSLIFIAVPIQSHAQQFVGSFTDLFIPNTIDVHLVQFQGTLYGVFTDRRSTGECRRLETVRLVNQILSPFQLCPIYSPSAFNVWFDVEGLNSQGQWEQIGVIDLCRESPTTPRYRYQLAYVGFNSVNIAMRDTVSLNYNRFLNLPICT